MDLLSGSAYPVARTRRGSLWRQSDLKRHGTCRLVDVDVAHQIERDHIMRLGCICRVGQRGIFKA